MADHLKTLVGKVLEWRLSGADNLSVNLMRQCIRGDVTPFDTTKIDRIDPRYQQELWNLIAPRVREALQTRERFEGLEISLSREIQHLQGIGPQGVFNMAQTYISGNQLSDAQIRHDIARALGDVNVAGNAQQVTVTDFFDFDKVTASDTTASLLWTAVRHSFDKSKTRALNATGRIFCREGENDLPTASSVPVAITLDLEKLGALVPETMVRANQATPVKISHTR